MKFKLSSCPEPSEGQDYTNEIDQVVPDQGLSLEEILTRFTRGEPLDVGFDTNQGSEDENPLNIDLEKLANSDLVDKAEFIGQLQELQKKYEDQEKAKAAEAAAKKQKEFEELDKKRIQTAARKLAKDNSQKLA